MGRLQTLGFVLQLALILVGWCVLGWIAVLFTNWLTKRKLVPHGYRITELDYALTVVSGPFALALPVAFFISGGFTAFLRFTWRVLEWIWRGIAKLYAKMKEFALEI